MPDSPAGAGKTGTTFRPALTLRASAGAAGCACGIAAAWEAVLAAGSRDARHVVAAAILVFPCALAAALLLRWVCAQDDALVSSVLGRVHRIPWPSVLRIDVHRRSFVVETDSGPVSAGWLSNREELLGLIVSRAGLVRTYGDLPWGVRERYVPKRQTIGFQPHHLRRTRGGTAGAETKPEEPTG